VIRLSEGHVVPSAEQLAKKKYYKWHDSYSHTTNECNYFRRLVHSSLNDGRLTLGASFACISRSSRTTAACTKSTSIPIPVSHHASLCHPLDYACTYVGHWLHHVSPHHSPTPMHMHVDHQLFSAPFPLVILAHLSSLVLAFFVPTCHISRPTGGRQTGMLPW
jgi:hypothetical protein